MGCAAGASETTDTSSSRLAHRRTLTQLQELIRVVSEAQERDAEDELRLYHPMRGDRPSSFQRRRPDRR